MSGYEGKRTRTTTQPMGSPTPTVWPGRRALTDRLSAPPQMAQGTRVTGIPIVDQGLACDDAETLDQPMPDCFLDERERGRLVGVIGNRSDKLHANWAAQCAAKRVEILATREGGYGQAASMLLEIFGGVFGKALGKALAKIQSGASQAMSESMMRAAFGVDDPVSRLTEIAAGIDPGMVSGPLGLLTSYAKTTVKEKCKHLPGRASEKANFVLILAAEGDAYMQAVAETLPAGLTDGALLLLAESLDIAYHSQQIYAAAIDDVLARYESSEIEFVGKSWEHNTTALYGTDYDRPGRLDVVRFSYGGRTRSALVENRYTVQRMDDPTPGAPRPMDKRTLQYAQWVRWLDADLAGAATAAYQARVGAPMDVDVEADATEVPPALMPFVSVWIAEGAQ